MWPETPCCELLPLEIKKLPGKPKVLRRKEPAKIQQNLEQLKWMRTKNKCGGCGQSGHNKGVQEKEVTRI